MYYRKPGCPMGTVPYTIIAGDTFYSIAMRYNISVNDIIRAIPWVNPYCLRVGQVICLPIPPMPRPCPAGTRPYSVQAGDTFFSIARRFNITVAELAAANPGVNPDALRVGQIICIPQVSVPPQPPTPGVCPPGTFAYTIRSGDTFFSLAQRFNTTVEAIQRANPGVDPNNLQIGQRICIPESMPRDCPSGTFAYTIPVSYTHLSHDALAKYAGLTWRVNQSGNYSADDTRMTKTGNKYLRYYLIEAANSVKNNIPEYKEFYKKKYGEVTTHQHKRALALTSRKLVRLIFGLLTKNQIYSSDKVGEIQ